MGPTIFGGDPGDMSRADVAGTGRDRFPVVPGYPGRGLFYHFVDLQRTGQKDLVVENECYQLALSGRYPGVFSWKNKMLADRDAYEMMEPECGEYADWHQEGSPQWFHHAVWGEEMHYTVDGKNTLWWDAVRLLFTPLRDVYFKVKVRFNMERHAGSLHVVQRTSLPEEIEPVKEVVFHYLFFPNESSFIWHNCRQFSDVKLPAKFDRKAVDAANRPGDGQTYYGGCGTVPPGLSNKIFRVKTAWKTPIGWGIQCLKKGDYDAYYWDREHEGLIADVGTGGFRRYGGAPEGFMMHYDSRGTYGGNGFVSLDGWTKSAPSPTTQMCSVDHAGWQNIADISDDLEVRPYQRVYGGACAPFLTSAESPVEQGRQIRDGYVDPVFLGLDPVLTSASVVKRGKGCLSVWVINPLEEPQEVRIPTVCFREIEDLREGDLACFTVGRHNDTLRSSTNRAERHVPLDSDGELRFTLEPHGAILAFVRQAGDADAN